EYLQRHLFRLLVRVVFAAALQDVDVIIAASLLVGALDIGSATSELYGQDVDLMDAFIRYSGPSNLAGLPALTVPVGLDDGLPIGLQIIGRAFDEAGVLKVGAQIERTNPMEGRRAPIGA